MLLNSLLLILQYRRGLHSLTEQEFLDAYQTQYSIGLNFFIMLTRFFTDRFILDLLNLIDLQYKMECLKILIPDNTIDTKFA